MRLFLEKNKEDYKLNIIDKKGKKEKFEYIKFINMIYEGEILENTKYGENITEDEKTQIEKMLCDINQEILKAH